MQMEKSPNIFSQMVGYVDFSWCPWDDLDLLKVVGKIIKNYPNGSKL